MQDFPLPDLLALDRCLGQLIARPGINGDFMRKFLPIALILGAIAAPLSAQTLPDNITVEADRGQSEELDKGVGLMQSGQPAEALKVFSGIIDTYEASHTSGTPYRCTYAETVDATVAHANRELKGQKFILAGEIWCTALWGKGFVLIDLDRSAEAGPFLARAVEMMPMNAHFINEYAEWYKTKRDWTRSHDLFKRAWETVDHDKQGNDRKVAGRSLRGMAFDLVEMGDLDQAEKLLALSLEYDPESAGKVQNELNYIAGIKATTK